VARTWEQNCVEEFHRKFGQAIGQNAGDNWGDAAIRKHRAKLVLEEALEFVAASGVDVGELLNELPELQPHAYLPDAVDGLCDLLYVIYGSGVTHGVDLRSPFEVVHLANMAKFGGGVTAEGKVIKPPGWKPPDLTPVLREQGWIP
jgi:predicted HAD superfamily Cof-like phosphohydrolase